MVALGLLTIWTGGCGSSEEVSEPPTETPAAESSPAQPDETASGEPEATGEQETVEEPEKEAFEEPLVEQQKEETAAKAGLIQSTKPEERLLQLKGSTNGATAAAPAAVPNQSVSDPFGVLPPLVVQRTPDPEEAAESLNLTPQEVPTIPEVPVAAAPPRWTVAAVPVQTATGEQPQPAEPAPPNLQARQVPSLPELPVAERPPQAGGRSPDLSATRPLTPIPQIPPGRIGAPPAPTTTATAPQPGRTTSPNRPAPASPSPLTVTSPPPPPPPPEPPTIPDLTVAQVPSLPELPLSEPPPQWRDPNAPPTPPPTALAPTPVLPPPPSIEIAKAISVSGVMQVGEETRVILKAPTEPTSRYVSVGERIANGQVLVKRVKFNVGSDPIVIFEQNGVEVAVEVGTFAETDEQLNLSEPSSPRLNTFTPS